jgi:hypothetical protein
MGFLFDTPSNPNVTPSTKNSALPRSNNNNKDDSFENIDWDKIDFVGSSTPASFDDFSFDTPTTVTPTTPLTSSTKPTIAITTSTPPNIGTNPQSKVDKYASLSVYSQQQQSTASIQAHPLHSPQGLAHFFYPPSFYSQLNQVQSPQPTTSTSFFTSPPPANSSFQPLTPPLFTSTNTSTLTPSSSTTTTPTTTKSDPFSNLAADAFSSVKKSPSLQKKDH